MSEYGEGAMRMNKATNFIILAARRAQKMWGLSDAALLQCLERVAHAEEGGRSVLFGMTTPQIVRPKPDKAAPPPKDEEAA
jgi:hypothetical protein